MISEFCDFSYRGVGGGRVKCHFAGHEKVRPTYDILLCIFHLNIGDSAPFSFQWQIFFSRVIIQSMKIHICHNHHGIVFWVESGGLYLFCWSCLSIFSLQKSTGTQWARKNRHDCAKGFNGDEQGRILFSCLTVSSTFYWTIFCPPKMYKQAWKLVPFTCMYTY